MASHFRRLAETHAIVMMAKRDDEEAEAEARAEAGLNHMAADKVRQAERRVHDWRSLGGSDDFGMPDHNSWPLFCLPELVPCCGEPKSFLWPGRRQCINAPRFAPLKNVGDLLRSGAQAALPEVLLEWAEGLVNGYSSERLFMMLNLMTAHEHLMLRLSTLDDYLVNMLERLSSRLGTNLVLVLMSDHGTHGTWLNGAAVGVAEHRRPLLRLVLPRRLLVRIDTARSQPTGTALAALSENSMAALVTPYDMHATLLELAHWHRPHQLLTNSESPSGHALALWAPIDRARTCEDAHVPVRWCLCDGGGV